MLNRDSKTSIFFNINYVMALAWQNERPLTVDFQKELLDSGLEFSQTNRTDNFFVLIRNQGSPLQVKLETNAPQVSSIHITAQNPSCDLEMFIQDCQAVLHAFQKTWPAEQLQVLNTAAKIHHLYSCNCHAFQYLWEHRLGQSAEDFKCLGSRPVAGGGIRLLLPPFAGQGEEPRQAEIRIESYFKELAKLFLETSFVWPKPYVMTAEEKFNPRSSLEELENYASEEVWDFLCQLRNG